MTKISSSDRPADRAAGLTFMRDAYANLAVRHLGLALAILAADDRVLWANPAFAALCGRTEETLAGTPLRQLLPLAEPAPASLDPGGRLCLHGGGESVLRLEPAGRAPDGTAYRVLSLHPAPPVPPSGEEQHQAPITREERKVLSQATGWFYAAKSLEELLKIVRRCMQSLIPEASGQLYIYSDDRRVLNLAVHWGPLFINDQIDAEDCWSLRRGRAYAYGTSTIDFPCSHLDDEAQPSFCLPVIAHGDTIGLLHLAFTDMSLRGAAREHLKSRLDSRWDLALICAEQISLAVANVRLRQELHQQSVRDQLTGLWNRRWFLEVAERDLNRALARKDQLSLISFDVDHFKSINDTFGHEAGDAVLVEVAAQIARHCDDGRAACRVGGEEFAVIAPHTDEEGATALAETIREAIESQPMRLRGTVLPRVTVSGGIATVPGCGDDLETLMSTADRALYASKAGGRNRITAFGGTTPAG